jgi:hypothetical protein
LKKKSPIWLNKDEVGGGEILGEECQEMMLRI